MKARIGLSVVIALVAAFALVFVGCKETRDLGVLAGRLAWDWSWDTALNTRILAAAGQEPTERSFGRPLAMLEPDGYLSIQGFHSIGPATEELVSLHFPNPRSARASRLGRAGTGAWASYFVRESTTDQIEAFGTDENHGGSVNVTRFDPRLRLVEGTFEFDGIIRNRQGPVRRPDMLRIRGSFRAHYDVVRWDAEIHGSD